MARRARRNPAPQPSRVTVADVLDALPVTLGKPFARAVAIGALTREGWLEDEAVARALDSRKEAALSAVLWRAGGELTALALLAQEKRGGVEPSVGALGAFYRIAPAVLLWMQEALTGWWESTQDPRAMLELLARSDQKIAVWTAAQIARRALGSTRADDSLPLTAIEAAERRVRGTATVAQVQQVADRCYAAADRVGGTRYGAFQAAAAAVAYASIAGSVPSLTGALLSVVINADRVGALSGSKGLTDLVRLIAACPELVP